MSETGERSRSGQGSKAKLFILGRPHFSNLSAIASWMKIKGSPAFFFFYTIDKFLTCCTEGKCPEVFLSGSKNEK
jgi:hypothetical protein